MKRSIANDLTSRRVPTLREKPISIQRRPVPAIEGVKRGWFKDKSRIIPNLIEDGRRFRLRLKRGKK